MQPNKRPMPQKSIADEVVERLVDAKGPFEDTSSERFDGNIIIGLPMQALAASLSTPVKVVRTVILLILTGLLTLKLGQWFGRSGVQAGLIIMVVAIIPTGMLAGWIDWKLGMLILIGLVVVAVLKFVRDYMK